MALTLVYPFTEEEAHEAAEEWGCNCGPTALAFAMQAHLSAVRHAIPNFQERRYTSPTMMKAALAYLNQPWRDVRPVSVPVMFSAERPALVRVQWTGPWTAPNANPKWAYRQTHWICAWHNGDGEIVFDVNGGSMGFEAWQQVIVPALTALYPHADGKWFPTHIWQLEAPKE